MIPRRRLLLLKLLISAVLLWFSFVLFTRIDDIPSESRNGHVQPHRTNWEYDLGAVDVSIPDPDRLRFEAAVRNGVGEIGRQNDEQEDEQEDERRFENQRAERIRSRDVLPSVNMRADSATRSSTHAPVVINGVDLSAVDDITRRLIEKGLLIPKWNLERETPETPNGTGEFGVEVKIVKERLSATERKEFDDGWQRNAFNQYLSDRISLHRALPDVRDAECKTRKYREKLPSASVIIIFHKEAWSVLLRTVHSVLDRSPPHLIKEIILVDDFSDRDDLKVPLEDYVAKLEKVRLVRAKKRDGLIRARLLGSSVATAEVLIFLDSHCECTKGWLEPLLDRIAQNRSNVVVPVIDVVNDETLQYHAGSGKSMSIGGFDWNLQFNWHAIPDREKKRRMNEVDPVWSPTMAGGLFGISREYFEYLGAYDPGMDIWGAENLELSFRIWMCGGVLEQVTCSRVGHIFRHRSPYAWRSGTNVLRKNSIRLAEVWMDEYKKYYYERINFNLGDYGDVTSRKELRKKLQCKSFDWYLKNVFPEMVIPSETLAAGEIRNKVPRIVNGNEEPICIDSAVDKNAMNKPVKPWPCHNQGGNQFWLLTKDEEIQRDDGCIDFPGEFIKVFQCHGMKGNQAWIFGLDNTIRHRHTNLCLQSSDDGTKLEMAPCTGIDRQIWYWRRRDTAATLGRQNTSLIPGVR